MWDDRGILIDSFLKEDRAMIVPAHGESRFRIAASTPATASDIEKIEVIVERSQVRGRWD